MNKMRTLQQPYLYDTLDQKLINLLRQDARMSISKLAERLHVSRGTVQNRLDRLLTSGALLGFTIRVHESIESHTIKAVMMIEVVGKSTSQVIHALKGIPELERLHSTNGAWDLVANINAGSLSDFDKVLGKVRMINGVLNSETSILLSSI